MLPMEPPSDHVRRREKETAVRQKSDWRSGPLPFQRTRTVAWGDCDPAGIIYTPRILDHAMEVLEAWNRDVLEASWMELNHEHDMGAPTVRVEIDFLDAPEPDQVIVSQLRVERLGGASVTYRVIGTDGSGDGGRVFYKAKIISCFISRPAFKPTPVPETFRRRIEAYRAACGES